MSIGIPSSTLMLLTVPSKATLYVTPNLKVPTDLAFSKALTKDLVEGLESLSSTQLIKVGSCHESFIILVGSLVTSSTTVGVVSSTTVGVGKL